MATFFQDRIVEHPGRVELTQVSGDVYDMAPAEGEITQEGTPLNADNLEEAVQAMIDSAINALTITPGGSLHVSNMQQGREVITPVANSVVAKAVTFDQEMESVPRVVVTAESAAPQNVSIGVNNISTTGFTIQLYRVNTTKTAVQWIAQC